MLALWSRASPCAPGQALTTWEMDIKQHDGTRWLAKSVTVWMLALLLAGVVLSGRVQARNTVHWAYSSFLGTGWYQVDSGLDVYVLRAPLSWDWRATDPAKKGAAGFGLTVDLPVTFGLQQVDGFDELLDIDNIGTVSFTPGIEAEWAVTERWWLRGYTHLGWGIDTQGDEQAWVWDLGLKSRYTVGNPEQPVGLFTEIFAAGYWPDEGSASSLGGLGAGMDFRTPLAWHNSGGQQFELAWDLSYRWYGDQLTFNTTLQDSTTITDEWRLGAALALRERRIKIWLFEFDQLGLGYRISSDGQFRGLTVNLAGPFRR